MGPAVHQLRHLVMDFQEGIIGDGRINDFTVDPYELCTG